LQTKAFVCHNLMEARWSNVAEIIEEEDCIKLCFDFTHRIHT